MVSNPKLLERLGIRSNSSNDPDSLSYVNIGKPATPGDRGQILLQSCNGNKVIVAELIQIAALHTQSAFCLERRSRDLRLNFRLQSLILQA